MTLMRRIKRRLAYPFALPTDMSGMAFMRAYVGAATRRTSLSLNRYDQLTRLATQYRSDKGITHFPFHGYTFVYAPLFERFRDTPINLLEIGLARRGRRQSGGSPCPSLSMWLDYFPKAQVFGLDIDDFSDVELPRTRIFQGDQGDPDVLRRVLDACPSFDIIIDDGSHASYHQKLTLQTLFPHLSDRGVYVVEDIHWQPAELEKKLPTAPKFKELAKDRRALEELAPGLDEVRYFKSPIRIDNDQDMGELIVLTKNGQGAGEPSH